MAERFDRDLSLIIGNRLLRMRTEPTLSVDSTGNLNQEPGESRDILRVTFIVDKGRNKLNQAEINVYNLSPTNRQLVEDRSIDIILEAGYVGARFQIFQGDLSFGENVREGTDWITTFEATDGGRQVRNGRVQEQTAAGAPLDRVLNQLAAAAGLGSGNITQRISQGGLRESFDSFATARVVSGNAFAELTRIARSAGLDATIEDGQVQLLAPTEGTTEGVAIIDASTGLIGSPERGDRGIVRATTLIRPQINPGRRVRLESQSLDGLYVTESIRHVGDTHGQPWYSELELKRIQ